MLIFILPRKWLYQFLVSKCSIKQQISEVSHFPEREDTPFLGSVLRTRMSDFFLSGPVCRSARYRSQLAEPHINHALELNHKLYHVYESHKCVHTLIQSKEQAREGNLGIPTQQPSQHHFYYKDSQFKRQNCVWVKLSVEHTAARVSPGSIPSNTQVHTKDRIKHQALIFKRNYSYPELMQEHYSLEKKGYWNRIENCVSVRFCEITNSKGVTKGIAGRRKSVINTIYADHKDYLTQGTDS